MYSQPHPADLIIIPTWIVPIVDDQVLVKHALVVTEGKIMAILPTDEAQTRYQAKRTLKLPEQVLLPGLINLHTHTPMTLLRGLADDLLLMDWLENYIWPTEGKLLSPDFCYFGSQLAIAEMIKGGITCFNDHYFFPQSIAQAAIETGVRAAIGISILEAPLSFAPTMTDLLQLQEKFIRTYRNHPLIQPVLAPHSPYMLTDAPLKTIQALSAQEDLLVHMHVSEPPSEIEQSIKLYQKRPIARLHDLGLLNEKLIAAHMLHLTTEDLRLLENSGISVAHCPKANQKLASGLCHVEQLLQAGLNVGLGTDGPASNNSLDLFSEMQFSALQAKGMTRNPTVLPAVQILAMATINSAQALRLNNQIGSLEVGKSADMITVDLNVLSSQPVYNPISQLVYACNRHQVSNVWIEGKQLLDNHTLTTLDEEKILAEAKVWAKQVKQNQYNAALGRHAQR